MSKCVHPHEDSMLAEKAAALALGALIAAGSYCNWCCCSCNGSGSAGGGAGAGAAGVERIGVLGYWDAAVADQTLLPWLVFFCASFLYLIYLQRSGQPNARLQY